VLAVATALALQGCATSDVPLTPDTQTKAQPEPVPYAVTFTVALTQSCIKNYGSCGASAMCCTTEPSSGPFAASLTMLEATGSVRLVVGDTTYTGRGFGTPEGSIRGFVNAPGGCPSFVVDVFRSGSQASGNWTSSDCSANTYPYQRSRSGTFTGTH